MRYPKFVRTIPLLIIKELDDEIGAYNYLIMNHSSSSMALVDHEGRIEFIIIKDATIPEIKALQEKYPYCTLFRIGGTTKDTYLSAYNKLTKNNPDNCTIEYFKSEMPFRFNVYNVLNKNGTKMFEIMGLTNLKMELLKRGYRQPTIRKVKEALVSGRIFNGRKFYVELQQSTLI